MADINIESLHKQALDGDNTAENQLFSYLFLRFQVITRKRIWRNEDAEEVIQEALKEVSGNYKTADLHGPFAAWAYKVLLHKIWDYYRRKKRQSKYMTSMENLELRSSKWVPDPTLEGELQKCMQKLIQANSRYARLLTLIYQGYSVREICDKLDITKGNCYTILSRARSMIKYCLQTGDIE